MPAELAARATDARRIEKIDPPRAYRMPRRRPISPASTWALERLMALSLYDASIPSYLLMLKNLAALLDKAEAHAKTAGVDPATYLEARLAPDMAPLTKQV